MEPIKPGFKTSEYWLTVASMIISAVYMSVIVVDGTALEKGLGLLAGALVALGYTVSRGLTKKAP